MDDRHRHGDGEAVNLKVRRKRPLCLSRLCHSKVPEKGQRVGLLTVVYPLLSPNANADALAE
jgi:hypothetical protein